MWLNPNLVQSLLLLGGLIMIFGLLGASASPDIRRFVSSHRRGDSRRLCINCIQKRQTKVTIRESFKLFSKVLGILSIPVSDFAFVYLTDCVRLALCLMGVAASLVACVRVAMSAFSFGLGTCYLLTDVLKFIFKAVILVATCYILLTMMEGKVDIHVESNGVHFYPLKFVREKVLPGILPVRFAKPFDSEDDKPQKIKTKPSAPIKNKQPVVEEEEEELEPPLKPKEDRSLSKVFRAILDYFVPG